MVQIPGQFAEPVEVSYEALTTTVDKITNMAGVTIGGDDVRA